MAASYLSDYSVGWDYEPFVDDVTPKMIRELKNSRNYLEELYWAREEICDDINQGKSSNLRGLWEATSRWLESFSEFLEDMRCLSDEEVKQVVSEEELGLMMDTAARYRRLLQ